MKKVLGIVALVALLAGGAALAQEKGNFQPGSGLWANWPILSGPSYCSSYVNGVCRLTIPAGPTATGTETMPGDTHAIGGSPPQQVLLPWAAAGVAKLDSTPTAAGTTTANPETTFLFLTNSGSVTAQTIVLPVGTVDGQRFTIYSTGGVAATITWTAASGQTWNSLPTSLTAATAYSWVYDLPSKTFIKVQ
jgi:hypothetical protein